MSTTAEGRRAHPDQCPVCLVLMRGLSALGHYEEAQAQGPDDDNRQSLTAAIERLKAGQDVN
ncbi:MAG TPA: hypothetical protein VLF66_18010 [Thermoanaerobaculia bacterium]|nr:hypothetical protein [Thermoanaerobaculia bacterium]